MGKLKADPSAFGNINFDEKYEISNADKEKVKAAEQETKQVKLIQIKMEQVKLTVRLPENLKRTLDVLCKDISIETGKNYSLNQIIISACLDYVKKDDSQKRISKYFK